MSTTIQQHQKLITVSEFAEIDFEQYTGPVELIEGEIVEMVRPTARHGAVCSEVNFQLKLWSQVHCVGYVFANDTGVVTRHDPDSVRGPDVCFISKEKLVNGEIPEKWLEVAPELCVEVLSAEDRWQDVLTKISEYLNMGILEIWIVDPELKNVQVYTAEHPPVTLSSEQKLVSHNLKHFECAVVDLFPKP